MIKFELKTFIIVKSAEDLIRYRKLVKEQLKNKIHFRASLKENIKEFEKGNNIFYVSDVGEVGISDLDKEDFLTGIEPVVYIYTELVEYKYFTL